MAFHWSSSLLSPNSVIKAGNWGRVLLLARHSHSLALRESVLEHIRRDQFSDMPSRLESAFFFDEWKQAKAYQAAGNVVFYSILYEVEIVNPSVSIARCDFRSVSPSGGLDFDWARNYWKGLPPPNDGASQQDFIESFGQTDLRIVRRVE